MTDKGKRNEATFQTEIKQSVDFYNRENKSDIYYRKDEDGTFHSWGYDCELWGFQTITCLELKICKQKGTLGFKTLFSNREHEIKKLLKVKQKHGFKAFVLVNHYVKELRINDVYIFSPEDLKEFPSIKINDSLVKLPRVKDSFMNRYVWDITTLL